MDRVNSIRQLLGAFFTLQEDKVLREQLKLLLNNCTSPTVPGVFLASVMAWSIRNEADPTAVWLWWLGTVVWRLVLTWSVKRMLAREDTFVHARRSVLMAIALNGVDMLFWGGLAWLALGNGPNASMATNVLVIAVLAGVAGNTMATLSPILPVFMGTTLIEVVMVASKAWTLGEQTNLALGVAAVLFALTLMGHARHSHNAALSAILLRFDNQRLIRELYAESEVARLAQAEAEKANQDKSRFLAAASHDLRQPIHAQGLFLEVLADDALGAAARARVLSSAKAAWKASSDMLNTLLDFSRIDAGVLQPQLCAFRLQPLLHQIETEVAPQADAKQLIYRSRETHLAVHSDPALIELILRNLVSNAVRYTEQGGVLVSARRRGKEVTVEVWDTGIGISAADHEAIFKEFHQLGNPERDRRKGLGLGLAIARGLTNELGHTLSLRSVPGRGSCFKLTLPLATGAIVSLPPQADVNLKPLQLRVLVVDDDTLVQDAMQQLLENWQCTCTVVDSPEQALAQAGQHPPDIILCDYRLRDQVTGADCIAQLRAHWQAEVPAILMTGDTAKERLREANRTGISVLHKPISPDQIHRQIRLVLGLA